MRIPPPLEVVPDVAAPGDRVTLRATEPGIDLGGPVSRLQEQSEDGSWETTYLLFSSYGDHDPWYQRPGSEAFVHAVALRGPVDVIVPPLEDGLYRIEREYVVPRDGRAPRRLVCEGWLRVA